MSYTSEKPGYIYVIAEKTTKVGSNGFTGYYKIGQTDNLDRTLSELQAENFNKIEYWECFKVANMDTAEQAAHQAVCRKYRSDKQEWYGVPLHYKDDFIKLIGLFLRDHVVMQWRTDEEDLCTYCSAWTTN